jgi:tetratricopeptide (TPR) repeat protein
MRRYQVWLLAAALSGAGLAGALTLLASDAVSPAPYRFRVIPPPDPDVEVAFYEERVRRDPSGGLDLAALAGAYLSKARRTGDAKWCEEAERAARLSLERLPHNNTAARLALAQVAMARHEFTEAIRLAGEVLGANARDLSALAVLVEANLGAGYVAAAAAAADTLVELAPTGGALVLRARASEARGRWREAAHDLETALRLEEPGEVEASAFARALLGRLWLRRGRYEDGARILEEAVRVSPENAFPQMLLAEAEARLGRPGEADRRLQALCERRAEPPPLIERAKLARARGDREAAEALFARAEELSRAEVRESPSGHRRELAGLLLERGRPAETAEALRLAEAEAAARRDAETLDVLAWALLRSGRPADARRVMAELLRTGVERAEFFARAAEIERGLGNHSRALLYEELAQGAAPRR